LDFLKIAEDYYFNFRFEFRRGHRDAIPDEPMFINQFDYVYIFGLQTKVPGL
jgi:hypothetical protein